MRNPVKQSQDKLTIELDGSYQFSVGRSRRKLVKVTLVPFNTRSAAFSALLEIRALNLLDWHFL